MINANPNHPRRRKCAIPLWGLHRFGAAALLILMASAASNASSGSEGAAFLAIPVGAGPAAMGSAYSALANDAYATTLNPAGLGFLGSAQVAGQHLDYLESIHYEYLGFGVPLGRSAACADPGTCAGSGLGGSVQYLGSGDIPGTDGIGQPVGNFSSYYSAYNLSYGRSFYDRFSAGVTGKWIHAKIADVSADAFATDFGGMYRANAKLTLAAVLENLGTKLTFLNQSDSLPLAFHLGAAYKPISHWNTSAEVVVPKAGAPSVRFGFEWRPMQALALRTGYRTDTLQGLGPLAGFTTGLGIQAYGLEFSYAWLPLGDLGNTHYFSLLLRLGESMEAKRNLIQYQQIKTHRTVKSGQASAEPEYQQLLELLSSNEPDLARPTAKRSIRDE